VIVVDVNSELNAEQELRELRKRVQRIVDRALDEPVRIAVRTRDSKSRFDDGPLVMS
jgi:hypothetical protein